MGLFDDIRKEFEEKIKDVKSIDDLRKIEVFFLGKKGRFRSYINR